MCFQEVRYKVRDPKAHSKGGTLENTINTSRSGPGDEPPPPTMHPLHPGKVCISTALLRALCFPKESASQGVLCRIAGPQQVPGDNAVRHRQVLAYRVPGVLRVLQPYVLDRIPARVGCGGRRPGAAGRQVNAAPRRPGQADSILILVIIESLMLNFRFIYRRGSTYEALVDSEMINSLSLFPRGR